MSSFEAYGDLPYLIVPVRQPLPCLLTEADLMTQIQMRIVTFERVKMGQDTNPGDVPFKKYYYQEQYDQLHMCWRESSRWTFAAYRCTECKSLFICSDSSGLQHGCTEGK